MKPLAWVGDAKRQVRSFPDDARNDSGHQLWRVQMGRDPDDWKPMPSIGPGVREIRIHTAVEHRICYVAKFAEAIYVLHAFEKRTRKTSQYDMERARQRYQALIAQR